MPRSTKTVWILPELIAEIAFPGDDDEDKTICLDVRRPDLSYVVAGEFPRGRIGAVDSEFKTKMGSLDSLEPETRALVMAEVRKGLDAPVKIHAVIACKDLRGEELRRIRDYLRIHRTSVGALVESALENFLRSADGAFEDAGECPNCLTAKGVRVILKGMSILDAETRGLIKLTPGMRAFAETDNTQFVVCPECLWWGYPSKR